MNTLTPTEAQAYLAERLRERIDTWNLTGTRTGKSSISYRWRENLTEVLPTSWDYIAHEVEGKMAEQQFDDYFEQLVYMWAEQNCENSRDRFCTSATYTQRATALKEAGIKFDK